MSAHNVSGNRQTPTTTYRKNNTEIKQEEKTSIKLREKYEDKKKVI